MVPADLRKLRAHLWGYDPRRLVSRKTDPLQSHFLLGRCISVGIRIRALFDLAWCLSVGLFVSWVLPVLCCVFAYCVRLPNLGPGNTIKWMFDFSQFQYNVLGLITLEYAPFWLLSGLIFEQILLRHLDRLQWAQWDTQRRRESLYININ